MTAKIIVCVTSTGATVAKFHSGQLEPGHQFPAGDEGQQALGAVLRENPDIPVYVMVDSVEEDYHSEALPHVSGSARQELVQRKLRQLYRNTSYCTASIQGREQGKRRDDRYLFAALTNTDLLRPWLEVLNSARAALAGVYLLPMVTQELVALLKLREPDLLVVSRHNGGLRQSFFHEGQLKASRLAMLDAEHGSTAAQLAAEIGKTRLYLNSLRLVLRETRLPLLLLDADDNMPELLERMRADAGFNCLRLTRSELSARLGGVLPSTPYSLHMTALGLHAPAGNLAPAGITRRFHYGQQRHILYGASVVVAVAALLWAGGNFYQTYQLDLESRQLETQTHEQQTRYDEVTKTFPQAPTSAANLERAVLLAERIRKDNRTPEALMLAASRALATSPEIMLTRLSWKVGTENRQSTDGAAPPAGRERESGLLEGEIRPFHGDYRAAMASVNRLVEKMRQDFSIATVSVVQMPLNIQSSAALSGNTLDAVRSESVRAEFKLRVVLKERA